MLKRYKLLEVFVPFLIVLVFGVVTLGLTVLNYGIANIESIDIGSLLRWFLRTFVEVTIIFVFIKGVRQGIKEQEKKKSVSK